eukprot:TRINITY_DN7506_c0_g1_i1.p1 TRINITY_DN7506_c0_g1~~TRINITY_DN7506_c0_g1_i1.p1  ORF type:complete len:575 (-),score=61.71 TRINITY_DN7506_c0_g1_i1:730-2388(-)
METNVPVRVSSLVGEEIVLDFIPESTVDDVRVAVSSQLDMLQTAVLFYVGERVVPYMAKLKDLPRSDDGYLLMNMITVDPMIDMGKFSQSCHNGIAISLFEGPQGEHSILCKTSHFPDSNNVMLEGQGRRPFFVEFEVVRTTDEMSFGVTYDAATVERASGFANLSLQTTWTMSKRRNMPVLIFGGNRPVPPVQFKHGFADNDRVMLVADPEQRQVRFFVNDVLVADNLPDYPLPEFDPEKAPLRVYCMVDDMGDEVKVSKWGPAESLMAYAQGETFDDLDAVLPVRVSTVGGEELSLNINLQGTVEDVRIAVFSKLDISWAAVLFYVGDDVVPYMAKLKDLPRSDDGCVLMSMIIVDPMLGMGRFDTRCHNGIEVSRFDGPQGEHAILRKTSHLPDSSNVMLEGQGRRPFFVEFEVVRTTDEMSFGVTYDAATVERASSFANLSLKTTWILSKRRNMPVFIFGGHRPPPEPQFAHGFANNDRVMLIADPEKRQIRFYVNGVLVGDNLPASPLPEFDSEGAPLRVYCMVDCTGDEVRIARWGPAEVLLAYKQ